MDRKKRLQIIIDTECNGNVKMFAESIGLNRPDRLYNVLKNKNNLSDKLAILIIEHYPKYTLPWLLTGEDVLSIDKNIKSELLNDFKMLISNLNEVILNLEKDPKTVSNLEKLHKAINLKKEAYNDFLRFKLR